MSNPTKELIPPLVIDLSSEGRSTFYDGGGTNYDEAFNAALKSAADRQGQTVQEYLADSKERQKRVTNLKYLTVKLGEDRNGNFDPDLAQSNYNQLVGVLSDSLKLPQDDTKRGVVSGAGTFPDGEKFLNFLNKVSSGDPRSINSFKAHLQSYKDGHVNDAWMNFVDNALHSMIMEKEGNRSNQSQGSFTEGPKPDEFSRSQINDGLPLPSESQPITDRSDQTPELYLPNYSTVDCLRPVLVFAAAVVVTWLLTRKSANKASELSKDPTKLPKSNSKATEALVKFGKKMKNGLQQLKGLFGDILGGSAKQPVIERPWNYGAGKVSITPADEPRPSGDIKKPVETSEGSVVTTDIDPNPLGAQDVSKSTKNPIHVNGVLRPDPDNESYDDMNIVGPHYEGDFGPLKRRSN